MNGAAVLLEQVAYRPLRKNGARKAYLHGHCHQKALGTMPAGERARLMAILAVPNVLALGLASFAGGYLVGRFGAGTGPRESATAGAMTAARLSVPCAVNAWSSPITVPGTPAAR